MTKGQADLINLLPIIYTDQKPSADLLLIDMINQLSNGIKSKVPTETANSEFLTTNLKEDEVAELNDILLRALLFKKKLWKYENEYRLITTRESS